MSRIMAVLALFALGAVGFWVAYAQQHAPYRPSNPAAAASPEPVERTERVPVSQVFMHEPDDYTVLTVPTPDTGAMDLTRFSWRAGCQRTAYVRLFRDVPPDTPAWVQVRHIPRAHGWGKCPGGELLVLEEIHLRNVADLRGADWHTGGKFPRHGATVELQ